MSYPNGHPMGKLAMWVLDERCSHAYPLSHASLHASVPCTLNNNKKGKKSTVEGFTPAEDMEVHDVSCGGCPTELPHYLQASRPSSLCKCFAPSQGWNTSTGTLISHVSCSSSQPSGIPRDHGRHSSGHFSPEPHTSPTYIHPTCNPLSVFVRQSVCQHCRVYQTPFDNQAE